MAGLRFDGYGEDAGKADARLNATHVESSNQTYNLQLVRGERVAGECATAQMFCQRIPSKLLGNIA